MLVIATIRNKWPKFTALHIKFYCGSAIVGYLLPMGAELFVIEHMPASVLTLIVSLSPLATLAFAWLMKTDRIDGRRIAGVIVGAVAIFAVLLPDTHNAGGVAWHWLLLATSVPISYALYHNYIARYWPNGSDSFQVACGEAIFASLLLILFLAFYQQGIQVVTWNMGHIVILIMAVIALLDIYCYFELIRLRGPIYVSHANYFMVISGVVWGMIIFSEQTTIWFWMSTLLLMLSLYLVGDNKNG